MDKAQDESEKEEADFEKTDIVVINEVEEKSEIKVMNNIQ